MDVTGQVLGDWKRRGLIAFGLLQAETLDIS